MQSYRWTSFPYLFLMTLVILSFQNCSSQYQISQSDFGDQASFNSTPTPAIIFNPAPSVINAADYDLSFSIDIIEEQIRSVECRINTLASFDCSNRLIELRNLADGSYTIIVNVTTTGGVSAENSIVIRKDSNAQAEPGINMRMVFMATGHQARTIMSCDDGRTWINDRSDNPAARCWVEGNPNYVECDHTPITSRGIDSADGWFFTSYGWGYPGTARKSRDGVNWQVISQNRMSIGLIISASGLLTWFSEGGDYPISNNFGQSWSVTRPPGNYYAGRNVAKVGNQIWISSDDEAQALYSSDGGLTLQPIRIPNLNRDMKVAAGNGVLVMLSSKIENGIYTSYTIRSTDGGITWNSQQIYTGPIHSNWSDLIFNGAEFVTWAGNQRYASRDGVIWSRVNVSLPINTIEGSVAFNPVTQTYVHISNRWGNFYANQKAYRSTDGITWTELSAQAFPGGHPISKIIAAPIEARFCP